MNGAIAVLCLAAALSCCSLARSEVLSAVSPSRHLLQSPAAAQCSRLVPNCIKCDFRRKGTRTVTICSQCDTGYAVKDSGRGCWCAPGHFLGDGKCIQCGQGHYCPGATSSEASGGARVACGDNMITTTEVARSERECVAAPGNGISSTTQGASPCPEGTYNSGSNTRKCSPCPGSLTTSGPGATSPSDCQAGPGHFFVAGKAAPCAAGSYKSAFGNRDCEACPQGFTTPEGVVGSEAKTDCKYVLPGFSTASGGAPGDLQATRCPANSYRSGLVQYNTKSGVTCTLCPAGTATPPGVTGASSKDQCVSQGSTSGGTSSGTVSSTGGSIGGTGSSAAAKAAPVAPPPTPAPLVAPGAAGRSSTAKPQAVAAAAQVQPVQGGGGRGPPLPLNLVAETLGRLFPQGRRPA